MSAPYSSRAVVFADPMSAKSSRSDDLAILADSTSHQKFHNCWRREGNKKRKSEHSNFSIYRKLDIFIIAHCPRTWVLGPSIEYANHRCVQKPTSCSIKCIIREGIAATRVSLKVGYSPVQLGTPDFEFGSWMIALGTSSVSAVGSMLARKTADWITRPGGLFAFLHARWGLLQWIPLYFFVFLFHLQSV